MRVTILNNLSKQKSVIRFGCINELSAGSPIVDGTYLLHSTIDKEGSGFLDTERRFKMRFEIRVHFMLFSNNMMRLNFYDKMFTDFFVFEFKPTKKSDILHGTTCEVTLDVYKIAQLYEVETICRKFEMVKLKQNNYQPQEFFTTCNQFNCGTALRVMLARVESVESLKKHVQSMDLERMSGEVMKKLAEKMFLFL
uniref:Uncharacterized protein n=1 Tax=Caenorhabditis japonica TaxID=281687 RepID=A0A8R1EGR0_CAEJA